MREGIRHDVGGHPVVRNGPNEDDFELNRGLPIVVDDEIVRQHFQEKHDAGNSKNDGDEMTRRYRFSVVTTKWIGALYRRGYELDGDFQTRVREVNKVSERDNNEVVVTNAELMISYGNESATKEAIKIAFFGVESYSFVSKNRPRDHYAFDMSDFQSYVFSKSKGGKVRGELIHVLHYYSLIDVPGFIELAKNKAEKNPDKPVHLKFLAGTPLSERTGINALMPVEIQPEAAQPDEPMEQAGDARVHVVEVEEFTGPKPPPPYDPLEDITKKKKKQRLQRRGDQKKVSLRGRRKSKKPNEWSLALRKLDDQLPSS